MTMIKILRTMTDNNDEDEDEDEDDDEVFKDDDNDEEDDDDEDFEDDNDEDYEENVNIQSITNKESFEKLDNEISSDYLITSDNEGNFGIESKATPTPKQIDEVKDMINDIDGKLKNEIFFTPEQQMTTSTSIIKKRRTNSNSYINY